MTVEAVPRTARMTITRIIQAGTGANQSRTSVRTVVNEELGVAKAGNACTAIRWVAGRLLSQYLLSIVFKDLPPQAKSCRTASRCSLRPPALSTDPHGRQLSPDRHA